MVRLAIFVRKRHRDLAPAAVEALHRLIDAFPPPALSLFAIPSGDWIDFDAKGLKAQVRKALIGRDKPINGNASVWGAQANIPDFLVEYTGSAIDLPIYKNFAAALWFSIAPDQFVQHRDRALELWRDLAEFLDASAGYVDIALEGDKRRLQALAKRYRHVDISDVDTVSMELGGKMPGVFWLNYLGPKLVEGLGGRAEIGKVLSPAASIQATAGGPLVIALGSGPSLGDVNRREGDGDRTALARHAHERGLLYVPRKFTYFEEEDELSDKEAQKKWHMRFVV
jgi:hypothetical protein